MSYHIVEISCSSIGTYPLQAVIDQIKTREEKKVITHSVIPYVFELCEVFCYALKFRMPMEHMSSKN